MRLKNKLTDIVAFEYISMIDFPSTITSNFFVGGCNFKCFYCHNKDLWDLEKWNHQRLYFDRYEKELGIIKSYSMIKGINFTGGEPTLWKDLPKALKLAKKNGFKTKIDTNGSNPKVLEYLFKKNLLDYIAMDIKGDLIDYTHYKKIIGVDYPIKNVEKSVRLILQNDVPYEFRTTIANESILDSLIHNVYYLFLLNKNNKLNRLVIQRTNKFDFELEYDLKKKINFAFKDVIFR